MRPTQLQCLCLSLICMRGAHCQSAHTSAWLGDTTISIHTTIWRLNDQREVANESAIRVGTALTLDCCSKYSELGRELQRGYQLFVEWVNVVRGGVMVQGVWRPIQLTTIGDHSSEVLVQNITQHFLRDGVQIFLGPCGSALSDVAAEVVNSSGDAVMVLPSATDVSAFRNKPGVFGMLPPSHLWLENILVALKELGAASVTTLQEEGAFPEAVCNGLPDIAAKIGLQLTSTFQMSSGSNADEFIHVSFSNGNSELDVLVICAYDAAFGLLEALQRNSVNFKAAIVVASSTAPDFLNRLGETAQFVIVVTPWVPWSTGTSDMSGWTANDFSIIYAKRYAAEPLYQAAAAFASGAVLVEAIEMANSDEPSAISEALRTLSSQSVFGHISFDNDGMNAMTIKAVQHSNYDSGPHLILPRSEGVKAALIYPAPPWDLRPCFISNIGFSDVGLIHEPQSQNPGSCTRCPDGYQAKWKEKAWFDLAAWLCIDKNCPVGHRILKDGTCAACSAGKFGLASRQCESCAPGRFSNSSGTTACQQCLSGSYAAAVGQTICLLCAPGFQSSQVGQASCAQCYAGRHAPDPGTEHCIQCRPGMISNSSGASVCSNCSAGKFSTWGSRSCEECPIGTYQHSDGESSCLSCPTGTTCTSEGLAHAANLQNWWELNHMLPDGRIVNEWHACAEKGVCLSEDRCGEGRTGILCSVCLPGYSHSVIRQDCQRCPPVERSVTVIIVILCVACLITYAMAALSVSAAAHGNLITPALIKIFLNYLTSVGLIGILLRRELKRRTLLRLEAQPEIQYEDARLSICPAFLSFMLEVHSYLVSVECLVAPQLSEQEEDSVRELATAKPSQYFLPRYDEARAILRDFHHSSELRLLLWCNLAPLVFIVLLLLVGAGFAVVHISHRRNRYKHVGAFMDDVRRLGWQKACRHAHHRHENYGKYITRLETRILGIWSAVVLATSKAKHCNIFLAASKPLLLVVFFLSHPYCMLAAMRAQRCTYPLNGIFGARLASAYDVEGCRSDLLYWYSSILILIMGLGVPLFCTLILLGLRDHLEWPRFRQRYGFLVGGYRGKCSCWECLLFVRKGLGCVVLTVSMSQGMRVLLTLCMSFFFALLHIKCHPYDPRFDELLFRMELQHLIHCILSSMLLLGMHLLPHDAPEVMVWICSIILATMHARFSVEMMRQLAMHLRNNYAEYLLQRAHFKQFKRLLDHYVGLARDHNLHHLPSDVLTGLVSSEMAYTPHEVYDHLPSQVLSKFDQCVLKSYAHSLDRLPYMAVNSELAWCLLIGSKGSVCAVPHEFEMRGESGLEFMPFQVTLPEGTSDSSGAHARRYLVKILRDAFEYIIVTSDITVFSSTLLEFVFRAGFTFGSDGGLRRVLLKCDSCFPSIDELGEVGEQRSTEVKHKDGDATASGAAMPTGNVQKHARGTEGVPDTHSRDRHHHQLSEEETISPSWWNSNHITSKVAEHLSECMFEKDSFLRGVTLEEFQLNISKSIMSRSRHELRIWFDAFEAKWLEHQSLAMPWQVAQEKARSKANVEIQVLAEEITHEVCGIDAHEIFEQRRELKSLWARMSRQLLVIELRRQAQKPVRHAEEKRRQRCLAMQSDIRAMSAECEQLSAEVDRIDQATSDEQMVLAQTREELAFLKAEKRRAALEIKQLQAELSKPVQGDGAHGPLDSAIGEALDDAAARAVDSAWKSKR